VTYGHLYPARDGGLLLQYWFFYPFNDSHYLFDHDADWEHVTVRLDHALRPLGGYYARHGDNAPGQWFAWSELAREGEHPVVLAARGSHASYASQRDARWYDRVCTARDPARAEAVGCTVWRTWERPRTGGILAVGHRAPPHPEARFISWPGTWGADGPLGLADAPRGPAFQQGWCALGTAECAAPYAAR
jgi:hypothetical protein